MSGVRDLRTWAVRSWVWVGVEGGRLPLGVGLVGVEAMWASRSSRREVSAESVWGVSVLRSLSAAVGEAMRWRWRVRAWMSFMRWDNGRSSEARRKMVRL